MGEQAKRERTIQWQDPMIGAKQAPHMAGIDYLRGIASGQIPPPPVGILANFRLDQVAEGWAQFILEPGEFLYNPIGSVHGGIIATLCDSAASCAIHTLLPAGTAYTTLEMKVNYIRPITTRTGTLRCTGKAIHASRRSGTAEARLEDEAGKLYAHATVTCMIFPTG